MKGPTFGWPQALLVAGSTVLSWLVGTSGPFTWSRSVPPAAATRADTVESAPIVRMHDWPEPSVVNRPRRDVFAFRTPVRPSGVSVREQAAVVPSEIQAPAVAPPLKLIGMARDDVDGVSVLTAILAGRGQVYLVKEGDRVAGYTVERISADGVELADSESRATVRLFMQ
jgi:hypothetical protein